MRLQKTESALVRSLERDSLLMDRVERLMTIPAVGPITALTWALEVGDVQRFSSIRRPSATAGCAVQRRVPAAPCSARRCPNSATNIYRRH